MTDGQWLKLCHMSDSDDLKNTHLEWVLRRKRSDCELSSDVGDNALLVCRGE